MNNGLNEIKRLIRSMELVKEYYIEKENKVLIDYYEGVLMGLHLALNELK